MTSPNRPRQPEPRVTGRAGAGLQRQGRRFSWSQAGVLATMIAGAILMVFPYLYMLSASFKTRKEFAESPHTLIPQKLRPGAQATPPGGSGDPADPTQQEDWPLGKNYVDAVRYARVDVYVFNSLLYAVVITVVQLTINTLAAYAFARMEFRGKRFLFTLLLATMMLPPAVLLVPRFLVVARMGLVDSFLGVVLPGFAGAFGIFLLRQFFLNIPASLEEAARLDGCGHLGILWRIILPLSKPVLITLGLFTFMGAWNSFIWPLVVLSDQSYYPLTVGLSLFRDESSADWPRIFAASVMGSAPLILLFLLAQRYLVRGISLSGLKGQ